MFRRLSRLCYEMAERQHHTFLFADISGYSLLTEREGDEAAADLAIRFLCDAAGKASEHGAEVVKDLGDAVMVRLDDAADAIRLGLDLLEGCDDDPDALTIHVGLHTGPALQRAGDWWGATVNVAARVAAAAAPGQLLVTEATKRAAGSASSARMDDAGALRLKNIPLAVQVYDASRIPAAALAVA
jgi:adenylate cyclase